jgi:hypothetical protein
MPPSYADRGECRLREPDFRRGCRVKVVSQRKTAAVDHHHPLYDPGEIATGLFQSCGSDIGLRHVMSSSALPTVLQSASRRADFSGLPGSLLLRPAKLLAPCADLTRSSSGHRGFYLQASDESVTLLAAGYNYDSYWIVLSKGLSPFGMTASVAAP